VGQSPVADISAESTADQCASQAFRPGELPWDAENVLGASRIAFDDPQPACLEPTLESNPALREQAHRAQRHGKERNPPSQELAVAGAQVRRTGNLETHPPSGQRERRVDAHESGARREDGVHDLGIRSQDSSPRRPTVREETVAGPSARAAREIEADHGRRIAGNYYPLVPSPVVLPGRLGASAIVFPKSTKGGASWSAPTVLSTAAMNIQVSIRTDSSNGNVAVLGYTPQYDPWHVRTDMVLAVPSNLGAT
jgi:hypothetical protein